MNSLGMQMPNPLAQMHAAHDEAKTKFDKLKEIQGKQQVVRQAFDSLAHMGDLVTQEDVVKVAGKVVAGGIEPMAVASILADMPPQGEALVAWISSQDQALRQKELQLAQVLGFVRSDMGLAALRLLTAQSFGGFAEPAERGPMSNPLAPPGPTASAPLAPLGVGGNAMPNLSPMGQSPMIEEPQ